MKDNLIQFPRHYVRSASNGFKINLYTEQEVEMALFCINIWGDIKYKVTQNTLRGLASDFVLTSLERGYYSGLLSDEAKRVINKIIKSIEPIHLKKENQK